MGEPWERLLKDRGYKIQNTLGEGAYSKVKSAYSNRLGREVAIKCINTKLAPKDFVEKFLPRELQTLPLLRHENIVRVYEILEASDGYVYIVMEAARNGDMLRFVQKRGALPEYDIKRYFWELCQAINYCHEKNICHRDLKCENLLLDKNFKLLLTDFGFSKPMNTDARGRMVLSSTFCGSAAYAAPEIIQGKPYDPRMHDMWSLGVILYIMSCGHMPFDDSNVKKMLKIQLKNHLRFPPRVNDVLSGELKTLIRQLIQPDVTQRATMAKVLEHPFFYGYQELRTRPSTALNATTSVAQQIYHYFTGSRPPTSPAAAAAAGQEDKGGCSHDARRQSRHQESSGARPRHGFCETGHTSCEVTSTCDSTPAVETRHRRSHDATDCCGSSTCDPYQRSPCTHKRVRPSHRK
ncbi:testis-specific serine/threonine-protein kinase 3-like [Ciona intestinalis]